MANRPGLLLRAWCDERMFDRILNNSQLLAAAGRLEPGRTVQLAGVWGSSAGVLAAALGKLADGPVLFVGQHLDSADGLADDVEILTGRAAELFPAWESDLAADHVSDEVAAERARLCNLLVRPQAGQSPRFIVAPIMALLQSVPSPQALEAGRLALEKSSEIGVAGLAAWLTDAGYESVEQVDQQGEFARRGGIVDIFPPGRRGPFAWSSSAIRWSQFVISTWTAPAALTRSTP